ncbi:hypothetical protein ACFS27_18495 [Promicromonospora vindobonensis]|uniref:Uncharacterized protein n=1 Tax=Promicromonospora vindobonensis TaxID=195748 RepID=A0ABW5VWE1_9MICO
MRIFPRTTATTARRAPLLPVEPFDIFPGRWVGGVAMVVGPLLLLGGALLRVRFDFFFPTQLAAFDHHPGLIATSYALFAAGHLLLWPAVVLLAGRVAARSPGWGLWGGALVLSGTVARVFHAGMDHMAFRFADAAGVSVATEAVSATYGSFQIFSALNLPILVGWLVLAVGTWRTRVLGPVGALALALTSALPLGLLKGTTVLSLVALAGLAGALVPLGLRELLRPPRPRAAVALRWAALAVLVLGVLFAAGQAG